MTEDRGTRPQSRYRPELDVLRFAAFLLVFVHHLAPREPSEFGHLGPQAAAVAAALANACGYGLSLFFVLSAFLITDLLLREKAISGTVRLGDFWMRRILRIWPLYFLGLLIGANFFVRPNDFGMLAMYALMIGNWYFVRSAWSGNPATPLWSISVEEQFYLLWPPLVKAFGARGLLAACGLMCCLAVLVELWLAARHAAVDTTVWTNSFVHLQTFAAGAALAVCLRGRTPSFGPAARAALLLTGALFLFVSVYVFSAKTIGAQPSPAMLVAGLGLAAIGSLTIFVSQLGRRMAPGGALVYLGRISFGLYVFHLLFIDIARYVALLLAPLVDPHLSRYPLQILSLLPTIGVAALSYRYVERPFLRLKERFFVDPATANPPMVAGAGRMGVMKRAAVAVQ